MISSQNTIQKYRTKGHEQVLSIVDMYIGRKDQKYLAIAGEAKKRLDLIL